MREAGLDVHIDVAGNFDGDVGSLGAIEVAQTLKVRGIRLRHPLQVFIFENEEGVMLGSTAIARGADAARLNSISQSGMKVRDGIKFLGGDPDRIAEAKRDPGSISAYVELHIEQGGVLEQQQVPTRLDR